MVAITSYSAGRVRICCRKASAITSLITTPPGQPAPGPAVHLHRAELLLGQLVAPVPEGALGVLHDVALVHQGDALLLLRARRTRCAARIRRLLPSSETGLMPMPLVSGKRIVVAPSSSCRNVISLRGLLGFGLVLDPGVDVLGVLPEDDHVHQLGMLDRRGHPGEPAHRPDAGVEIELLPERHVERAEPAADRRGERPLDGHEVVGDRPEGVVREPAVELVLGLLAGEDLEPDDLPACRRRPSAPRASKTSCDARQMSGPVPSPSMNGMIGRSGTWSRPCCMVMVARLSRRGQLVVSGSGRGSL